MKYDIIVVGGRIVGLSTAWNILKAKPRVRLLLIEKEGHLAKHQTGNNSGVIHSGIYYKPGSLKAVNCREGYAQMLDFCEREGIPYEICGKIIVATRNEELPKLEELMRRGQANGLEGLRKLDVSAMREVEPHINGIEAIYVPQAGIVDYKMVSERLGVLIQELGGEIRLGESVEKIESKASICSVETSKNAYECKVLVTCAGLQSDRIAR